MERQSVNLSFAGSGDSRVYFKPKKCKVWSQQVCRMKEQVEIYTCPSGVMVQKGSLARLRSKVRASPLPTVYLMTDEWVMSVSHIWLACFQGCRSSGKSDNRSFQNETPASITWWRSCILGGAVKTMLALALVLSPLWQRVSDTHFQ